MKSNLLLPKEGNQAHKKNLFRKFIFPPFSILDTRQGYWQRRRRMWLNIGIKGELGRGDIGKDFWY